MDMQTEAGFHLPLPVSADGGYVRAIGRLVQAVQELSLAHSLEEVQAVVRHAARELTGCDGATFVLRDNGQCYYADEDAIAPLWKGCRFPLEACISGWSMLNRQPAVIPDIYADARIPHEAYRPTFVKSLVMVPIRTLDPIGAIGNYWAHPHHASDTEVALLQALADSTSVAMRNAQVWSELEARVRERTAALEQANAEIQLISVTDEMTGLHNRRGFYLLAEPALAAARRREGRCLLAYVDVDGLKRINDEQGHEAGDVLIVDVARVLRAAFRSSDVLARMGGDEFCALVVDTEMDEVQLRQRIDGAFAEFNRGSSRLYPLSSSIGIVTADPADHIDELLAQADARMYVEKRARRSRQVN
ncbi:MAG TPA: sensor domain-containing diguanylate cyclase [Arenimonas sp.]|nr:sensor domain-containing diguanylate cyclase [Arenimonas sp.]